MCDLTNWRLYIEKNNYTDIVDIKPANMEELTEVITASEFHPSSCNLFVYSSSKGTIRLCDMRAAALCDKHSKRERLIYIFKCVQLIDVVITDCVNRCWEKINCEFGCVFFRSLSF